MLFGVKPQGKLIFVVDIQSSAINGTLFLFTEAESKVIFETAMHLPPRTNAASGRLIKSVLKAVSAITLSATRHLYNISASGQNPSLPKRIAETHIILSSPWIVSQAKRIDIDFEKETSVTSGLVMNLINKEREAIPAGKNDPIRVIEQKIFDVKMNGYSLEKWEGRTAKTLSILYAASFASSRMIEMLARDTSHYTRTNNVKFHSAILLSEIAAEKFYDGGSDFGIVYVHGDITDVAIVTNHCLAFSGSFPMGYRTTVKKLSSLIPSDIQTAESAITLYTGGCLDKAESRKEHSSIEKVSSIWKDQFSDLINTNPQAIIPASIFVVACPHEEFFSSAVSSLYPKIGVKTISSDSYARDVIHNMEFRNHVLK